MSVVDPEVRIFAGLALLAAVVVYLLPSIVALARNTVGVGQIVALNIALGWTGAAWAAALVLAFGPRQPGVTAPHPTRPAPRPPQVPRRTRVYRDGWYILSSGPESTTWAVCEAGRWRIVYEVGGFDRLVAPVEADDVPIAVLTEALVDGGRR